jgi:hypothetical protein
MDEFTCEGGRPVGSIRCSEDTRYKHLGDEEYDHLGRKGERRGERERERGREGERERGREGEDTYTSTTFHVLCLYIYILKTNSVYRKVNFWGEKLVSIK